MPGALLQVSFKTGQGAVLRGSSNLAERACDLHHHSARGGSLHAYCTLAASAAGHYSHVLLSQRLVLVLVLQMAVLTTMAHPNIVRVFACLTDMKEEAGEALMVWCLVVVPELLGASGISAKCRASLGYVCGTALSVVLLSPSWPTYTWFSWLTKAFTSGWWQPEEACTCLDETLLLLLKVLPAHRCCSSRKPDSN